MSVDNANIPHIRLTTEVRLSALRAALKKTDFLKLHFVCF